MRDGDVWLCIGVYVVTLVTVLLLATHGLLCFDQQPTQTLAR